MTAGPTDQRTVERETNATIKLILMHMEALARTPPEDATDPYSFEDRRQQVMRKVWNLVKLSIRHGHSTV